MTYKDKIIEVLKQLGGHAYLNDIYNLYLQIYASESIVPSYKATIRDTIERNSSDSQKFKGTDDIFYSVDGKVNGHWGLRDFESILELTQEDDAFSEGKLFLKQHIQRERNPILIHKSKKLFKQKYGHLFCEVCGFDFEKAYGELGADFIEAHHIKPVSSMSENEKTKVEDIVMVCSNCHSMIHRRKPWLNKNELKKLLK